MAAVWKNWSKERSQKMKSTDDSMSFKEAFGKLRMPGLQMQSITLGPLSHFKHFSPPTIFKPPAYSGLDPMLKIRGIKLSKLNQLTDFILPHNFSSETYGFSAGAEAVCDVRVPRTNRLFVSQKCKSPNMAMCMPM
jgi:hypothetical protein